MTAVRASCLSSRTVSQLSRAPGTTHTPPLAAPRTAARRLSLRVLSFCLPPCAIKRASCLQARAAWSVRRRCASVRATMTRLPGRPHGNDDVTPCLCLWKLRRRRHAGALLPANPGVCLALSYVARAAILPSATESYVGARRAHDPRWRPGSRREGQSRLARQPQPACYTRADLAA